MRQSNTRSHIAPWEGKIVCYEGLVQERLQAKYHDYKYLHTDCAVSLYGEKKSPILKVDHLWHFSDNPDLHSTLLQEEMPFRIYGVGKVIQYTRGGGTVDYGVKILPHDGWIRVAAGAQLGVWTDVEAIALLNEFLRFYERGETGYLGLDHRETEKEFIARCRRVLHTLEKRESDRILNQKMIQSSKGKRKPSKMSFKTLIGA